MLSDLLLDTNHAITYMENLKKWVYFNDDKNVTWGHPNINNYVYRFNSWVVSISDAFSITFRYISYY
jgi:hypothetical protein